MKEVNFETFRTDFKKCENKLLCLNINTFITSIIAFEKCQIIINNNKIIVADKNDLDITIDIDPFPKFFMKDKSTFKIKYDLIGELEFNFYN